MTKVCYYATLGLDVNCGEADIKRAYRKLALSSHPDKTSSTGQTYEEATQKFQVLQEAYVVLSDAKERAWYDSHREQILGGDDTKQNHHPMSNLRKFISPKCFKGFGAAETDFYSVYRNVFEQLQKRERVCRPNHCSDLGSPLDVPEFGDAESAWMETSAFYKHWLDFATQQSFMCAWKWNPQTADTRQSRRTMEAENKKAEAEARKNHNAIVRELVRFVQELDPRVAAHRKSNAEEAARKKAEIDAAQKQASELRAQQAAQRRRRLAPVARLPGCR